MLEIINHEYAYEGNPTQLTLKNKKGGIKHKYKITLNGIDPEHHVSVCNVDLNWTVDVPPPKTKDLFDRICAGNEKDIIDFIIIANQLHDEKPQKP